MDNQIKIKVLYKKKTFEIEINSDATLRDLKSRLVPLTNVDPDYQYFWNISLGGYNNLELIRFTDHPDFVLKMKERKLDLEDCSRKIVDSNAGSLPSDSDAVNGKEQTESCGYHPSATRKGTKKQIKTKAQHKKKIAKEQTVVNQTKNCGYYPTASNKRTNNCAAVLESEPSIKPSIRTSSTSQKSYPSGLSWHKPTCYYQGYHLLRTDRNQSTPQFQIPVYPTTWNIPYVTYGHMASYAVVTFAYVRPLVNVSNHNYYWTSHGWGSVNYQQQATYHAATENQPAFPAHQRPSGDAKKAESPAFTFLPSARNIPPELARIAKGRVRPHQILHRPAVSNQVTPTPYQNQTCMVTYCRTFGVLRFMGPKC